MSFSYSVRVHLEWNMNPESFVYLHLDTGRFWNVYSTLFLVCKTYFFHDLIKGKNF